MLGAYEAIKPLIAGLADGYRHRDMSQSGGERAGDRAFRMADLDRDFLITSRMTQAIATGTTGGKDQVLRRSRPPPACAEGG